MCCGICIEVCNVKCFFIEQFEIGGVIVDLVFVMGDKFVDVFVGLIIVYVDDNVVVGGDCIGGVFVFEVVQCGVFYWCGFGVVRIDFDYLVEFVGFGVIQFGVEIEVWIVMVLVIVIVGGVDVVVFFGGIWYE